MKAIILAAGRSTRLYPLTLSKPKCLLKIGKKTILEQTIDKLNQCNVTDITIITGYLKETIEQEIKNKANYIYFPEYSNTNNLLGLYFVKDLLNEDCIILFADVLIQKETLQKCINDKNDFTLIIDTNYVLEGTMRIQKNKNSIIGIGNQISPKEGHGNFIGIAKFSSKGIEKLKIEMEKMSSKEEYRMAYYTLALDSLAKKGEQINFIQAEKNSWIEIDTQEDLEKALKIYSNLN